ncbi:hypothetical protein E3N88_40151 [Mikania micrantha]|uniref:3-oxo-5-alpha-steroid 4-dehydrogenase C-terminal domain-containing protein n=1 Tax=Mikania micrantha TaxID=192012 RepID=A0A5N6LLX8_9ASTR|nr:hypothetical protein E3N88_40151 [Mikania micrantha]
MIYDQYLSRDFTNPPIDLKYVGVGLFLIGIIGNFYHHYILANLRKDGEKEYKIPQGGLFDLVICPHYLFEVFAYGGISCILQTLYAFAFALGTVFYLTGRSYATREWYMSKFGDKFPKEVKAIVFKSREKLMTWVQNMARSLGFVIIITRSKKNPIGYMSKIVLGCERGGVSRERCVSLWTDKHLNFGNSTSNRVASQHSKLKRHLNTSKCYLDRFVVAMEEIVNSQDSDIKDGVERSKIIHKRKYNKAIYQHLHGFVSHYGMDKILPEVDLDLLLSVDVEYGDLGYEKEQLLDKLLNAYIAYKKVLTSGIDEIHTSLAFSVSPAPQEHWLVMPKAGILIAKRPIRANDSKNEVIWPNERLQNDQGNRMSHPHDSFAGPSSFVSHPESAGRIDFPAGRKVLRARYRE